MWNSADYYAITGTLRVAGTVPGKVRTAVGLMIGLLPVWMLHHM